MTLTQLDYIFIALLAGLLIALGILTIVRKRPGKLKERAYHGKWQDIQKLCADKEKWPEVLLEADALLGKALKKRKYKGKSFGERLVSAQRDLTDNDGVWYGHKLAKKVAEDPTTKLTKTNVKDALLGIRRALKDLGALK